ncbi:MAG: hypothetical protein ACRC5A_16905 [Enterobacteriaceae bacterium]
MTRQPAQIKVTWPITRNAQGEEFNYTSPDDIMRHLGGEREGSYLISTNNMWHGGLHITSNTTPWCAPPKSGEERSTQPVRCIADGEIIAFRFSKDYHEAYWPLTKLKFSSTFVLIKHQFIPPQQTEEPSDTGQLTFYSLYMHLAPWSCYQSGEKLYQATSELRGYHM